MLSLTTNRGPSITTFAHLDETGAVVWDGRILEPAASGAATLAPTVEPPAPAPAPAPAARIVERVISRADIEYREPAARRRIYVHECVVEQLSSIDAEENPLAILGRREVACSLFAEPDSDVISHAAASYSNPTYTSVVIDPALTVRSVHPRRRLVGDLHTHPGAEDVEASDQDLCGWASRAVTLNRDWIGIVATPSDLFGFTLHAWVARPGSRPVVERAAVELLR